MQQLLHEQALARPARTGARNRWGRLLALLALLLTGGGAAWGQTLTNYAMAPTAGTFTAITGTAPGTNSSTTDDDYANALPIGFQFVYMGTPYTTVAFSTNGWLSLGGTLATSVNTNALATNGVRPVIAPLWDDLNIVSTGNFTYQTTGTVGSRVFTAQWKATKWYYDTNSLMSFQVKLYESNGVVQFVYSPDNATSPGTSAGASVGITSTTTGSGSYLSLSSLGTAPTVSSTSETTGINAKPAAGQTYTFTAPAPTAPTSLTFSTIAAGNMTANFVDNSTTENKFLVQYSADNTFATFSSTTVASTTTGATGTSYAATLTGLTPSTTYYVRVVSVAEANSTALTGSQATAAPVPLCGTYSVGPTGTYNSLTAAFNSLNANGLSCAVVFELQAAYAGSVETFPVTYSFAGGSATNTVTVRPATGATGRVITSSAGATFNVNGGKYLIIDGRPGGSGSPVSGATTSTDLTIINTSTTGYGIRLSSDATFNTVQHCQLQGASTTGLYPVVYFGSTASTTGNSNNTIQNNTISGVSSSAPIQVAILSYNNNLNSANSLLNNNLVDCYSTSTTSGDVAGGIILLSPGNGWIINLIRKRWLSYPARATRSFEAWII